MLKCLQVYYNKYQPELYLTATQNGKTELSEEAKVEFTPLFKILLD